MKFIVLDTETTGLNPKTHSIIQIAWVIFSDGKEVEDGLLRLLPWPGSVVSDEALKIHGLDINSIEAVDFIKAYQEFKASLDRWIDKYNKRDKLYVFGYNVRFDMDFVRSWFLRCGDKYMGSYFFFPPIDVMNSVAQWSFHNNNRADFKNFKLATVADFLNIEVDEEKLHDAMGDVRLTIEVMKKIGIIGG